MKPAGFTFASIGLCLSVSPLVAQVEMRPVPGQAELGTVEIRNVGAGAFDAAIWRTGNLNLLPDVRSPIIAPRLDGGFRNIYAPSAVEIAGGWRLFYGAWDGVPTANDRIYSVLTRDFLTFSDWQIVVDHGAFIHVCNVNAIRGPTDDIRLVCTAYPVGEQTNKPAVFRIPARPGLIVTSRPESSPAEAIQASTTNLVTIENYDGFAAADMNGMNVLLFEDGQYRLYFGDFKKPGHVYRASSTDGKHFHYEGPCLAAHMMVNDVRKFESPAGACYLMGLHANGDHLWYAVSSDGMQFEPPQELARSLGPTDRYIVAIGWVTRAGRVLGFVCGAGAVPELNRNRLFARWLQKKLVLTQADGTQLSPTAALGPERAILSLGSAREVTGKLQLLAEDGKTAIGAAIPISLKSGAIYRVSYPGG